MAKVTSKLQLTLPRALAKRYGIAPGDEVAWEAAGDVIRLVPTSAAEPVDIAERLRLFDKATERQHERERQQPVEPASDRGWKREDLYERGSR
jgi:bifunctional DNA-binding transcriptional regulator/antitoxin component of YhaV-PrlF toxin-antitoxin module